MATAKQIAANRKNSLKSTGPKSAEGKAKVSQNRVIHGLAGQFQVIESESQELFDYFLAGLIRAEQPVGEAEMELVCKMGRHSWLSERAVRCQNACFEVHPTTPDQRARNVTAVVVDRNLERHTRYMTANDRAYQRAAAELAKRKKERRLAEIGFEREKRAQAEEIHKQAAEQRRQNKENREQQTYTVKAAIQNEKLMQQQFRTAREAAAFDRSQTYQNALANPDLYCSPAA